MIFLRSLRAKGGDRRGEGYPFDLPLVRGRGTLAFRTPVTFFAGENGTGTSTILEAITAAAGSIAVDGAEVATDGTLAPARRLGAHLTLSWTKRTRRGFFLRAEDVVNFGGRTAGLAGKVEGIAAGLAADGRGDWERTAGLARGQRAALVRRYGEDLNARSHGESFLRLFRERFVPGGLYLLDEPDTALSPRRQLALLALLALLKWMAEEAAQFVVATHSPILLAFLSAAILGFDGEQIGEIFYDDVPNAALTRAFPADPAAYLRHP